MLTKYQFSGYYSNPCLACATGAGTMYEGVRKIRNGTTKLALVGGCDINVFPIAITSFENIGALSTKKWDNPKKCSRPFDTQRDGMVISDGVGLMVLEELNHALNRNANILAEIKGIGTCSM